MKKVVTILLALFSLAGLSVSAQTNPCNAAFNINFQNANTVQFIPVVPGTTASTYHYWSFGDGNTSNAISPVHTYTSGQVFTVGHLIIIYNPNGAEVCRDSSIMTITLQNACNLVVNFTFSPVTASPNTIHFENTTTPLNPSDSIFWNFGDGTSSFELSPNHTYSQPGTYTVCLRVKQNNAPGTVSCVRDICKQVIIPPTTTCNLIASFTWAPVAGTINTYHFQNTSVPLNNTDSIRWTFGDGTSSSQANPDHSYTQPGTYTVCLRIQQRDPNGGLTNCIREICHSIVVQGPAACNLVVNFYAFRDSIATVPLSYHFVNTSTPLHSTDSISWTFGDGTSSNQLNPTHIYAQPGTYNVCLRIQQRDTTGTLTNCVRTLCHTLVVQAPSTCNLIANFTFYRDSLNTQPLPYVYHFQNTSVPQNNNDSIRWTFGDGTSSNQVNPTHAYTQAGTYTVCLRIQQREPGGTLTNCIREICRQVVIAAPCNIQSNFTWRADTLNARRIYFTNTSITSTANATALWSFGDGTSSTAWNPVHLYTQPGRYYVCLKVQNSATCFSYHCDSVTVQASPPTCTQQSNFSFVRSSTNSQLFFFTPSYVNSNWHYTWTFGDGTGSFNAINPSHQYQQPGSYTVCLTVYRDSGCASTTCKQLYVFTQVNCNNINVSFNYQRDPVIANKYYFQALSNYTITSQTWTITKLPATAGTAPITLHQNNPAFVFQDTGYYRVCLRAVTLGGCVKEYCREIYIQQITTPANCSLQVYPNPVTSVVNMNLYLTQPQMIDVYIYNSLNILVKEKHQQGFSGTNLVSVPVTDLVSGIYTMRVIHGNSICYAQFVKL